MLRNIFSLNRELNILMHHRSDTINQSGISDDTWERISIAETLWSENRYKDALNYFEQSASASKANVWLQLVHVAALFELSRFDKALDVVSSVEKLHPDNLRIKLWKAGSLVALEDFNRARDVLEFIRLAHPKDSQMLIDLASLMNEVGDHQEALNVLQDQGLSAIRDTNPDALITLGRSLTETDQFEAAIPILRTAITLDPTRADAYGNLGIAYAALGLESEAITSWRNTLKYDPNDRVTRYNLGIVLSRTGSHKEAVEFLENWFDDSVYFEFLWVHYGTSLREIGKFDIALPLFEAIHKSSVVMETKYKALLSVAICKAGLKDYVEALAILDHFNKLFPDINNGPLCIYSTILSLHQGRNDTQEILRKMTFKDPCWEWRGSIQCLIEQSQ